METQITFDEVNARINALAIQRNEALDQIVMLAGTIAARDLKIKELEAKLAEKEKTAE